MISIDEQQKLLLNAARRLTKKINVYAIGGTAMMFLGLKDSTLDIDLVFENTKERDVFKESIKSLGYKDLNPNKVYGIRKNQPEMLTRDNERFDLFVGDVIDFIFSDSMQKRAEQIHQYGENLVLKIADPHDIILMKCATDRLKDKDDARNIIQTANIKWDILISEVNKQIELGKEKAAFDLGEFCEHLKEKMGVNIPKGFLDSLYKIVEKQMKDKQKKNNQN